MRSEPSLDSPGSSGEQLELQIPEPRPETPATEASRQRDPKNWRKPWTKPLVLTMAAFIALIFAMSATQTSSQGTPNKPEQFNLVDSGTSALERRKFPPIDLPREGQVIQVGIFTKLGGAERKQIALTSLGLTPYVQKRITENGLQYAVLLGPLPASTHDQTLATLTKNNYSYFHRPKTGS